MAMKKLEELCDAKNVVVKDLEEDMYQLISGASTFVEISEDDLKAEMPPHATLLTLIGQDKRPLKGWDKCSSYERVRGLNIFLVLHFVGTGTPACWDDNNHPRVSSGGRSICTEYRGSLHSSRTQCPSWSQNSLGNIRKVVRGERVAR